MKVTQIVEAVLFASDAPLKAEEIARADESLDEDVVEEALRELKAQYAEADRAFQVVEVAEGYQLLTLAEYAPYLERFDTVPRPSRLSGPALETLAIIAYRQPIGRIEIEYVRGVACGGVIRTLQDRGLVDVVGRAEGIGRPLLYGTTHRFLEHFGFRSLEDLPRPEELPVVLREPVPLGVEEEEEPGEGTPADEARREGPGGEAAGEARPGPAAGEPGAGEAAAADPAALGVPASAGSDAPGPATPPVPVPSGDGGGDDDDPGEERGHG